MLDLFVLAIFGITIGLVAYLASHPENTETATSESATVIPASLTNWVKNTLSSLVEPVLAVPNWQGDILTTPLPSAPAATVSADPVKRWASLVTQYAMGQIEINKALAVIKVESSGNPNAQNPSDPSSGLMGITPLIGRSYGLVSGNDQQVLQKLFEPSVNIKSGVGFLLHLQSRYASKYAFAEWVIAYNAGETNFDKGYRNNYGGLVQSAYQELKT